MKRYKTPCIKGMFVNSHINVVRKKLGARGIEQLRQRFGHSLKFGPLEAVPVALEVTLLDIVLDLLEPELAKEANRDFASGQLHFRNFTTTPLGRLIFAALPHNIASVLSHAQYLAPRIFSHVKVRVEEQGQSKICVEVENGGYPLEHFRGLLQEWLVFFALEGTVEGRQVNSYVIRYTITWHTPLST